MGTLYYLCNFSLNLKLPKNKGLFFLKFIKKKKQARIIEEISQGHLEGSVS